MLLNMAAILGCGTLQGQLALFGGLGKYTRLDTGTSIHHCATTVWHFCTVTSHIFLSIGGNPVEAATCGQQIHTSVKLLMCKSAEVHELIFHIQLSLLT